MQRLLGRVAALLRPTQYPQQPALAAAGQQSGLPSQAPSMEALVEALTDSLWKAVPKGKVSHRRKRIRQMASEKHLQNKENMYPCPKCEHGYLKLRHHLCPCDMEACNMKPKKVQYGAYRTGNFADR